MQAVANQQFEASLVAGAGVSGLGARVEAPVTRDVVVARAAATAVGSTWTVTLTAPDAGEYQLVWTDSADRETFVPLLVADALEPILYDVSEITPDVEDVAALLIARTSRAIDDDVSSVGAFTDRTTPTEAQVLRFAALAAADVRSRVGVPIPPEHTPQARAAAALHAAELVELSLVPEGASDRDRGVATQFAAIYRDRITDLRTACLSGYIRLV